MHPVIDTLMREHRIIESVLEVLGAYAQSVRDGAPADRTTLERFAEFFSRFADRRHHGNDAPVVGLDHGRDRPLATYSKGMLQRIGLAQALVHDPELVMLDEPTAGVDPMGARDIKDLIVRLKSEGKTVVLSSHLLEQVEEVCDRVAILHLGHKIVEGPLEALLSSGDRITLEVAGYDDGRADAIRAALASAGAELRSVGRPRLTLEEIFVREVRRAGGDKG